jgi:uncharacterized ion transporter superfamily protein YfcC
MSKKNTFLSPITILMMAIVISAIATWILPAGKYNTLKRSENSFLLSTSTGETTLPFSQATLDSLKIKIPIQKFVNNDIKKAVSVPGTYYKMKRNPQGLLQIIQAPLKGIMDGIDIILFILIIGGFMYIFNETGAMIQGVTYLSHTMIGKESWLIIILTTMFSFFGASYGMAEEGLVFYPILVPLFIAAGYDLLVPLAVIFGGTNVGGIASFSNPFSTIIASNAAGINWMEGFYARVLLWVVITILLIWYILHYVSKVKNDASKSIVLQIDGIVKPLYELKINHNDSKPKLEFKTIILLIIYIATFLGMIAGVVFLGWWTLEMSTLFVSSSILIALISRMSEAVFVREFIKGAESLLAVAFILGIARGVTIILNEGLISDSILYYASNLVQGMPPALFIILLMLFFAVFSLFISSSSGMAVITMPIMGALAIIVNIPGKEVVNAYMYGINIMALVSPTNLILPSIALANVSLKSWFKFVNPLLLILTIICSIFLIIGIYVK